MNRRQVLIGGSLGVAMLAGGFPAAARRQDAGWGAALPETVTFEPLGTPTAEERERLALLAVATRNTWGPEGNLSGDCFDFFTGGPEIVLVEEGMLKVSVFDPREPSSDLPPEAVAPPTVFRVEEGYAPAYVEPGTQLMLGQGDSIVLPDATKCGKYGEEEGSPVTFLEVTMLPGLPTEPWISEDTEMTGEVVEIGADGGPGSPIVVGRLRFEPSATISLEELAIPVALFLEEGGLTVNAAHDGMLGRDVEFAPGDRTVWLASGQDVGLVPGNHVYIPATATGTVTATGAVSCLMVAVDIVAMQ